MKIFLPPPSSAFLRDEEGAARPLPAKISGQDLRAIMLDGRATFKALDIRAKQEGVYRLVVKLSRGGVAATEAVVRPRSFYFFILWIELLLLFILIYKHYI